MSEKEALKPKRKGLKGRPLTMTCSVCQRYFRSAANRNDALYTVLTRWGTNSLKKQLDGLQVSKFWTFLARNSIKTLEITGMQDETSTVTPSFYCMFLMSHTYMAISVIVPSLKKSGGNYLKPLTMSPSWSTCKTERWCMYVCMYVCMYADDPTH